MFRNIFFSFLIILLFSNCEHSKGQTKKNEILPHKLEYKQRSGAFNRFLTLLENLKTNNKELRIGDVRYAKIVAEEIEKKEDSLEALAILRLEASKYGTSKAKEFYSLNPKLDVTKLYLQSSLQIFFLEKKKLSLRELRKLSIKKQKAILEIAKISVGYYELELRKYRCIPSKMKNTYEDIQTFIDEAKNLYSITPKLHLSLLLRILKQHMLKKYSKAIREILPYVELSPEEFTKLPTKHKNAIIYLAKKAIKHYEEKASKERYKTLTLDPAKIMAQEIQEFLRLVNKKRG